MEYTCVMEGYKMMDFLENHLGTVFLNDIVVIYLLGYMHRAFYRRKEWTKNKKWAVWLTYALAYLVLVSVNEMRTMVLTIVVNIACYLVPLFILYQVDNLRGFGYYAFFGAGGFALEIMMAAYNGVLKNSTHTTYGTFSVGSTVVLSLMEIALVYAICFFGSKNRNLKFDRVTGMFAVVPTVSILLILIDYLRLVRNSNWFFNQQQYLGMVMILAVVNIVFFVFMEKYIGLMKKELAAKQNEMKLHAEAEIMEMATKTMQERLSVSEELIQQDRAMRHDRRHFEALLLSLLQEGKIAEVQKCLEERMSQEPRAVKRYCENTTVNAAITHYVSVAEKEGIPVRVAATIPREVTVDETQLAIAISNLLENAIHACKKVPKQERFIEVSAKYKSQLLLEIANSCEKKVPLDEEGHPFTTEENHGIGTRSVLSFVKQTDSEIRYIAEEKQFRVRMIIG